MSSWKKKPTFNIDVILRLNGFNGNLEMSRSYGVSLI